MPNYRLTPSFVATMTSTADSLCKRRVDQAQTGFPLTNAHVRAALISPKWRETFEHMRADGVDTISRTSHSVFIFDRSVDYTIERTVLLQLSHSDEFHTNHKHARAPYNIVPDFDRGSASVNELLFDPSLLTPDEQAALAKWVNNVVQEKRLTNIARKTIGSFLDAHLTSGYTLAHVATRWPALKYLAQGDRLWADRFNNIPRNLKPYAWSIHSKWHTSHAKAMALTDMVLTSAAMLPATIENTGEVKAVVLSWRPLPLDRDSP